MGRRAGTGAALLAVLALSGCTSAGFSCTEIGWRNSVPVVGGGPWLFSIGQELPEEISISAVDVGGGTVLHDSQTVTWSGIREPNGPGCGERADTAEVRVVFSGAEAQRS